MTYRVPRRSLRALTLAGLSLSLAACQGRARRLLLIDESFTQPAELEPIARPWHDAGYEVEYRRYYPHLTRADLNRYRVVMVLGSEGSTPAMDALDVGDLAILTEWTQRGGVVVLGYPTDGGAAAAGAGAAFDRWLMNRWLAWSGAGITIGAAVLGSTAEAGTLPRVLPVLTAGVHESGFLPFPAGVNNALRVDNPARALARAVGATLASRPPSVPPAVVAASRTGNGLILVVSRSTLGAGNGPRSFLLALARFTRRPAEWSRIPPAGVRVPLDLTGGPKGVTARSPRAGPPAGLAVERLARRSRTLRAVPPASGVPAWFPREGLRALEAEFPALAPERGAAARGAALESLMSLLDVGGFNALVTDAHAGPLIDSVAGERWKRDALRAAWQQVTTRLQSTSVRWIPLVAPGDLASSRDTLADASCPLDPLLWSRLVSAVRALARLAAAHRDVIPAVGLRVDESARSWSAPPFCDAAWQAGLDALARGAALSHQRATLLKSVPPAARYDSLLEGGLLAAYDSAVAGVVVQRTSNLRADLRRARGDLSFAVVLDRPAADWFTLGLIEGMSDTRAPALVFSPAPPSRAPLAASRAAHVLHVLRLDAGSVLRRDPGAEPSMLAEQDGFWLGPAESLFAGQGDSLARQVRRIGKRP